MNELSPTLIAATLAGGYLLGSVPFGVVIMRAAGAGDPRAIGSGNIGATNVLRSGRRGLALLTLLGDGGKGALAVLAAWLATRHGGVQQQAALTSLAGGSAFLGHLFPAWLRFKGGKGVATAAGVLFAIDWRVGLAVLLVWLAVVAVSRYSSLGGIVAAVFAPAAVYYVTGFSSFFLATVAMGAILLWRHESNIRKLLNGEERRIGEAKKEGEGAEQPS
jgi:glycerol-3-phosphate acyltransferase PlsY